VFFNCVRLNFPGADIERVQERIGLWSSSAEPSDIPRILYVLNPCLTHIIFSFFIGRFFSLHETFDFLPLFATGSLICVGRR